VILGLGAMVAANAAAALAAHAVWRRLRTANPEVDAILFLVLRLVVISAAVMLAGISGLLTSAALGLAGVAAVALLLVLGEHRHVRRPAFPEVGRVAGTIAALVGIRMLLQVWFFAPTNGDVLSYHLPKVAEWIRAGRFTAEMGLDPCVSFPAGFELVETWWVVFLHHDVLIEMAGVEFAVLAFAAVRAIGVALGLPSTTSFLAAGFYLLTPLFGLQAVSCLNDGAVAALVLAAFALALARSHPALLAIPLALGAGIKGTFLYAMPGVALLFCLRRDRDLLRPASMRWTVPPLAVAAALGLFWYLRNALWYGNPFHPMTSQGFDLGVVHVQAGPRLDSLRLNVSDLVSHRIGDGEHRLQSDSYRTAGWGVIAIAGGAMGLIQGMREDRSLRLLGAAFAASLGTVLLLVSPDGWYPRFVLFFPALLSIGAARLASASRPAAALILAGAAVQFATTCLPGDFGMPRLLALMAQPWRERSVASLLNSKDLPPGEPVAVYATIRASEYSMYGPDYSRRVIHLRVRDADEMVAEMVRQNVRYVYVAVASHHRKAQIAELVRTSRLRALNENLYVLN
jgi:hypothetical protein